MNAMSTNIKSVPVTANLSRKVWLTRKGALAPTIVPAKTQTAWDAYVVETESASTVEKFPRISAEGVYTVTGGRPTEEIKNDYLRQVQSRISEEESHELAIGLADTSLTIATVIHSTKAL